ncbi:MAG: BamA/TamA family outer membrane protein [Bacteroidota bacterium]
MRRLLQIQISVLLSWGAIFPLAAQTDYALRVRLVDTAQTARAQLRTLPLSFSSREECDRSLTRWLAEEKRLGYVALSVDSLIWGEREAGLVLFMGKRYQWGRLDPVGLDPDWLRITGWEGRFEEGKVFDWSVWSDWQNRCLDLLENSGYPFARVGLTDIRLESDTVRARLLLEKGMLYRIDSIRVYGGLRIDPLFLNRYLMIAPGEPYSKQKIGKVDGLLRGLSFVEWEKPSDLSWLATGSVLNVYVRPRKSSQLNALIGFLPDNTQTQERKLLVTGEANVLLRNSFGKGETIGLNWQQLQVRSPRLSLLYRNPYVFGTAMGLDVSFDMFRKDSSFLNVQGRLGVQYVAGVGEAGRLFMQWHQSVVTPGGINTARIIQDRRLPEINDLSNINVGLEYEWERTDYRFNPRRGWEAMVQATVGTKRVRPSRDILSLKDPVDPGFDFARLYDTVQLKTYLIRLRVQGARYLPMGEGRSTIKLGIRAGYMHSGSVFRNEQFQIGGFRTLRGFDEESQYLTSFAIGTVEYRLLAGQNSYFYGFTDVGWGESRVTLQPTFQYRYLGAGLGLNVETRAGLINLAWALGKRSDTEWSARQSKIHVGWVNYF